MFWLNGDNTFAFPDNLEEGHRDKNGATACAGAKRKVTQ